MYGLLVNGLRDSRRIEMDNKVKAIYKCSGCCDITTYDLLNRGEYPDSKTCSECGSCADLISVEKEDDAPVTIYSMLGIIGGMLLSFGVMLILTY